jgi:competence protein ComGF
MDRDMKKKVQHIFQSKNLRGFKCLAIYLAMMVSRSFLLCLLALLLLCRLEKSACVYKHLSIISQNKPKRKVVSDFRGL